MWTSGMGPLNQQLLLSSCRRMTWTQSWRTAAITCRSQPLPTAGPSTFTETRSRGCAGSGVTGRSAGVTSTLLDVAD